MFVIKPLRVQSNAKIRIALAQINAVVGAIEYNKKRIYLDLEIAKGMGVDVLVFPEMAITGYPPEDLLLKPHFIQENHRAINKIAESVGREVVLVGCVDYDYYIYNAMAILNQGEVRGFYRKNQLPNYGVFDEYRYFKKGFKASILDIDGVRIGLSICEDIWSPGGVCQLEASSGNADILINISASPYHMGKTNLRERMFVTRAIDYGCHVLFCNMVGGQDELVFDGNSLIIDELGEVVARGFPFEEDFIVCDLEVKESFRRHVQNPCLRKEEPLIYSSEDINVLLMPVKHAGMDMPSVRKRPVVPLLSDQEEILEALKTGLRDYVKKNKFKKVLVGLSGGIDSALVAAIAVFTLGKENVTGVSMPSIFTSKLSIECIHKLVKSLEIDLWSIPIDSIFKGYNDALKHYFKGLGHNETEENIQARIRGNLLMAISNKFGYLVLATGNKSELSVGFCTLYGDLAGGYALIKDIPKTMVYELSNLINQKTGFDIIPKGVILRPPSAELSEGQKDEDILPPYPMLDAIIRAYVEDDKSLQEILHMGFDEDIVCRTITMIDRSEYKRRQAPPGVKITYKAFGKDRRMPITQDFNL